MEHTILFGYSSLQEVPINLTLVVLPSTSLPAHFLCSTIFSGLGHYVFSDCFEKGGGSINIKKVGDQSIQKR